MPYSYLLQFFLPEYTSCYLIAEIVTRVVSKAIVRSNAEDGTVRAKVIIRANVGSITEGLGRAVTHVVCGIVTNAIS